MRILSYIDCFGFEFFGGARRVLYETNRMLAELGNDVSVICRREGNKEIPPIAGVKFLTYDDINGNQIRKIFYYRQKIGELSCGFLKSSPPDLIIIHSSSSVFGMDIPNVFKDTPSIYMFHSPWNLEYEVNYSKREQRSLTRGILSRARKIHEFSCMKKCKGLVNLSQYMRNVMFEVHPNAEKIPQKTIPGGADLKKFYPLYDENEKKELRKRLKLPTDTFLISTARRLIPRMGLDILIRAFLLAEKHLKKDSKLVIAGEGPLKGELELLSLSLGLKDKVLFPGFINEKLLADFYRASDLFIMPAKQLEGFGLATVEALACGVPVIGTDVGGTSEILNHVSRDLIIGKCEENQIAEKIIHFSDNNLLWSLKEKCVECVKNNFTWKKHVESLLDFYGTIS